MKSNLLNNDKVNVNIINFTSKFIFKYRLGSKSLVVNYNYTFS